MSDSKLFRTGGYLYHDPAFCLAPGMFRSLLKGDNEGPLVVNYEIGHQRHEIRGPYLLGPVDLRVLQGLVAIAPIGDAVGGGQLRVVPNSPGELGKSLWESLEPIGQTKLDMTVAVRTSFRELAREIGLGQNSVIGGTQTGVLRRSIERLWMTSVIVEDLETGNREGSRLISRYQSDKTGFVVALNFSIASIVLGVAKRYTRISMAEIRALKTDPARLMHQRLCAWIDPGKTGRIELDTLCGYVWFEPATNIKAIQKRRRTVRKALGEFEALGWEVVEYAKGKFAITRRGEAN